MPLNFRREAVYEGDGSPHSRGITREFPREGCEPVIAKSCWTHPSSHPLLAPGSGCATRPGGRHSASGTDRPHARKSFLQTAIKPFPGMHSASPGRAGLRPKRFPTNSHKAPPGSPRPARVSHCSTSQAKASRLIWRRVGCAHISLEFENCPLIARTLVLFCIPVPSVPGRPVAALLPWPGAVPAPSLAPHSRDSGILTALPAPGPSRLSGTWRDSIKAAVGRGRRPARAAGTAP